MINPTSDWLVKHGYSHWGVRQEGGFYIHTLDAWDVKGETTKHVEVNIARRAYDKLTTDTQRRKMLYTAILREEERHEADDSGNCVDCDSCDCGALGQPGGVEGAGGESK